MRNALGRPVDNGEDVSGSDDGHQVGDPDVELNVLTCSQYGALGLVACPIHPVLGRTSKGLTFSHKSFVTCFPGQRGKPSFG
jgi:hypothetical protein